MNLKTYREQNGLSPEQMAAKLGIAAWSVCRYEAGRVPRTAIMAKIREVTGGAVQPADFYETPPAEAAAPRGARSPKAAGGRGAPKAPPATPKRRRAEARAS